MQCNSSFQYTYTQKSEFIVLTVLWKRIQNKEKKKSLSKIREEINTVRWAWLLNVSSKSAEQI